MMIKSALSAEEQPTRIGAVYHSEQEASNAAHELKIEPGLPADHVAVVEPEDPALGIKLEPEGERIWYTAVRAHIASGIAGLLAGLLVASVLVIANVQAAEVNPVYTIGILMVIGGLVGMMFGGMFTLRPDHDLIIQRARNASEQGHWFVLVHVRSDQQKQIAENYFEQQGKQPVFTL